MLLYRIPCCDIVCGVGDILFEAGAAAAMFEEETIVDGISPPAAPPSSAIVFSKVFRSAASTLSHFNHVPV